MQIREEIPDKAAAWLEEPKIVFDRIAHSKIQYWVDKCDDEISGLGKVVREEDGSFLVKEVMLFPQENTGGSTEIDGKALAKAMFELKDAPGELNFWWHSHVNMAVFWSKTDSDTIKQLGERGYFLASVFNKKGHQRNAIYATMPVGDGKMGLFVDDIEHEVVNFVSKDIIKQWDKEYEKNVKKKTFTVFPGGNVGSYGSIERFDYFRKFSPLQYEIDKGFTHLLDDKDLWWRISLNKDGTAKSKQWGAPPWVDLADIPQCQREFIQKAREKEAKEAKKVAKRYHEMTDQEWLALSDREQQQALEMDSD